MKYFSIFLLAFISFSCRKNELYGHLSFSGKVIDKVSGLPLSNIKVYLAPYTMKKTEFGFYGEELIDNYAYIPPVVSDSAGNYKIDFDARGYSGFEVVAVPDYNTTEGKLYVSAISKKVDKLGNYNFDLSCLRSATLKINIINAPPYDTTSFIAIYGLTNFNVSQFYNDTVAYLLINGDPSKINDVRFSSTSQDFYKGISATSWDTIVVNYNY